MAAKGKPRAACSPARAALVALVCLLACTAVHPAEAGDSSTDDDDGDECSDVLELLSRQHINVKEEAERFLSLTHDGTRKSVDAMELVDFVGVLAAAALDRRMLPVTIAADPFYPMMLLEESIGFYVPITPNARNMSVQHVQLPLPVDVKELLYRHDFMPADERGEAWLLDPTTVIAGVVSNSTYIVNVTHSLAWGPQGRVASHMETYEVPTDDASGYPTDPIRVAMGSFKPDNFLALPQMLMFYRRDLLANFTPPRTWDDLLSWAASVNGTVDVDGDGDSDYALCLDMKPNCKLGWMFMSIMAPHTQGATSDGLFFDPPEMQPLMKTEAARRTLQLLRELSKYNVPLGTSPDMPCLAFEPAFSQGRCLLTINAEQFRAVQVVGRRRGLVPVGGLGAAPAPGSLFILDREADVLRPCTLSTCPHALELNPRDCPEEAPAPCYLNRAPLLFNLDCWLAPSRTASSAVLTQVQQVMLLVQQYITRWPRHISDTIPLGNVPASTAYAPASATEHAQLPTRRLEEAAGPQSPAASPAPHSHVRRQLQDHTTKALPLNLAWLIQIGYDANETQQYLDAYWGSLFGKAVITGCAYSVQGHVGNMVTDLLLRGSSWYRMVLAQAAWRVLYKNTTEDAAMDEAHAIMLTIRDESAQNVTRLKYQYWVDLRYSPDNHEDAPAPYPEPASPTTSPHIPNDSAPTTTIALATVLSTVALLSFLAAFAFVYWHRKHRNSGQAAGAPPGVSPESTLLVTDIQDSTLLWETLSADVMDTAIGRHHDVLRRLMTMHSAYESATEGDSFIIAFHTPADATAYAVAAQLALCQADWPAELLAHPSCEQLYLQPTPDDPVARLSSIVRELQGGDKAAADVRADVSLSRIHQQSLRPQPPTSQLPKSHSNPLLEHDPPATDKPASRALVSGPGSGPPSSVSAPRAHLPLLGDQTQAGVSTSGDSQDAGFDISRRGHGQELSKPQSGLDKASEVEQRGGATGGEGRGAGGEADNSVSSVVRSRPPGARRGPPGPQQQQEQLNTHAAQPLPSRAVCMLRGHDAAPGDDRKPCPKVSWEASTNPSEGQDRGGCPTASDRPPTERCQVDSVDVPCFQTSSLPFPNASALASQPSSKAVCPAPSSPKLSELEDALPCSAIGRDIQACASSASMHHAMTLPVTASTFGSFTLTISRTAEASGCVSAAPARGTSSPLTDLPIATARSSSDIPAIATGPAASAAPSATAVSLTDAMRSGWRPAPAPVPAKRAGSADDSRHTGIDPTMVFRGMRVRMGIHTGLHDPSEVSTNSTTGRAQYSGSFLATAKAVCDAAHGGQVLLTAAAFKALSPGQLPDSVLVLHMGQHILTAPPKPADDPDGHDLPGDQLALDAPPTPPASDWGLSTAQVELQLSMESRRSSSGEEGAGPHAYGAAAGLTLMHALGHKVHPQASPPGSRAPQGSESVPPPLIAPAPLGTAANLLLGSTPGATTHQDQGALTDPLAAPLTAGSSSHASSGTTAHGEALYQLLPQPLATRFPLFKPPRTHSCQELGVPDAPVGCVTVAFMHVVGCSALQAWNRRAACRALLKVHALASECLAACSGYKVELVDGLCLATFQSAADALQWALRTRSALLDADWSDELSSHAPHGDAPAALAPDPDPAADRSRSSMVHVPHPGTAASVPPASALAAAYLPTLSSLPLRVIQASMSRLSVAESGSGQHSPTWCTTSDALGMLNPLQASTGGPLSSSSIALTPLDSLSVTGLSPQWAPLPTPLHPPGAGGTPPPVGDPQDRGDCSLRPAHSRARAPSTEGPSAATKSDSQSVSSEVPSFLLPTLTAALASSSSCAARAEERVMNGPWASSRLTAVPGPTASEGPAAPANLPDGLGSVHARPQVALYPAKSRESLSTILPAFTGLPLGTDREQGPPSRVLHGRGFSKYTLHSTMPASVLESASASMHNGTAGKADSASRLLTLLQGLRIKVGVDTGLVSDSINSSTGRMSYRGRTMNRAARIVSKALPGQVHCSANTFSAAQRTLALGQNNGRADEVVANSLGLCTFKGVAEKIEVLSISFKPAAAATTTRKALAKSSSTSYLRLTQTDGGYMDRLSVMSHTNSANAETASRAWPWRARLADADK